MSAQTAIIGWLLLVVVTAIVVSFLARRWGRDPFGWVLLSAAMGPIALIALLATHSADRNRSAPVRGVDRPGAIVVACDGSEVSGRLADHLIARRPTGTDILLVAVLPYETEQDAVEANRRSERMTAHVRDALDRAGIESRIVVRYGSPGEAIVRLSDEVSASLIVVGRRGGGLSRALLGSVSTYVVQHAGAPVVLVT